MSLSASSVDQVHIARINGDFDIRSLESDEWAMAVPVEIDNYWSGEKAPHDRSFRARLLWSPTALYVRFTAEQHEPLIVSDKPDLTKKADGLWNRDVCEIFIAPDKGRPAKYFEFEAAPTGEWIDLAIDATHAKRLTELNYVSGMTTAGKIDHQTVTIAMKIPFATLGGTPKAGDVWLGNLFRCVGTGATRGYLTWRPTMTPKPSFHVPAAFGRFVFQN